MFLRKGVPQPTSEYKKFYEDFCLLCKDTDWQYEPDTKLKITMVVQFSNRASDLDNAVKPLLDALQKFYGFNDKYVYELHVFKKIGKKGEEYAQITIEEYKDGEETSSSRKARRSKA